VEYEEKDQEMAERGIQLSFENLPPLFSNLFDFLKEHILLPNASLQDIRPRGKLSSTPLNETRKF
jgi:hypothetical protein